MSWFSIAKHYSRQLDERWSDLTIDEVWEVVLWLVAEVVYEFIGHLTIRRDCYFIRCSCCGVQNTRYYPHSGAYFWQREFWTKYNPECPYHDHSCRPTIVRSFDAVRGTYWDFPGYRRHFKNASRIQYLLSPPDEQMRLRILDREFRRAAGH